MTATLCAEATKKRAGVDLAIRTRASMKSISQRNCCNVVRVQNELGRMERSLRDASSRGPDGVSLAAVRPIAPVSYSRMLRARPRPLGAFTSLDLPEKANTFSGLFAELIHTVVFAFGAPAGRRSVNLSSTAFDASPSVIVKTSGRLL